MDEPAVTERTVIPHSEAVAAPAANVSGAYGRAAAQAADAGAAPSPTHVAATMASAMTAVRKSNRGQQSDCQGYEKPTHQTLLLVDLCKEHCSRTDPAESSRGLDHSSAPLWAALGRLLGGSLGLLGALEKTRRNVSF
jgi:hypothetical protein